MQTGIRMPCRIPSGKPFTVCYGKSPSFIGQSTINGYKWPFWIAILDYQRLTRRFLAVAQCHWPQQLFLSFQFSCIFLRNSCTLGISWSFSCLASEPVVPMNSLEGPLFCLDFGYFWVSRAVVWCMMWAQDFHASWMKFAESKVENQKPRIVNNRFNR